MTHSNDFYLAKANTLKAFRVQGDVVGALILRESRTRFGESRLGYFWAFGEPCMHFAAWFLYLGIARQGQMYGISTLAFLAAGIIPLFLYRRVATYVQGSITCNRPLLNYPLVKHMDLMIARFVLEAATMLVVSFVSFVVLIALGYADPPDNFRGLIPVSAAMLVLGFGFGSFNAVATLLAPAYEKVVPVIERIIYFTSGLFYMVESLPPAWVKILALNPACHGLELFRSAYFHSYKSSFASVWYIFAWGLGLQLLAMAMERVFRETIQESNS